MSLSADEVSQIARLARLDLTEAELERYRGQLSAILDYFAELSSLDTTGVEPTARVEKTAPTLRRDEPRPGLGAEALEENAPDWHEGQFRVPPVFE